MNNQELLFLQIKQNVIEELKKINLDKKDKDFLLDLINLFNLMTKSPNENFINSLINLIENAGIEKKEELNIRLASLNSQIEQSKFIEIRHFSFFSMYIKKEKVEIYIKKITLNWNNLVLEIKKINFTKIRIIVYKSISRKEKILNKLLNKEKNWEEKLINIIETNVCVNIYIILDLKKEEL